MSERFHTERGRRSWGRVVEAEHQVARAQAPASVGRMFERVKASGLSTLAFGLGRSYGDSNLNPGGSLIETRGLDRFMAFDAAAGTIRAEAGVSLDEILRVVVPAGYFLPTTPGSRFVTLGGAIANDVHGKNHHAAGTFGRYVRSLTLARSDGTVQQISPDTHAELFAATLGGLGLTGIILNAEIALTAIPSALIAQRVEAIRNVDHFFELAEVRAAEHEHTVAWIDCTAQGDRLGQGVFSSGDWASPGGHEAHSARMGPSLPFDAPSVALNPVTLRSFNALYRWRQLSKPGLSTVHYSGFFYPLDAIGHWNRLYGPRGFYQYQSVIPFDQSRDATRAMLDRIARSGEGSFLAVLKTFGSAPSPGLLSFPMPGVTLALDFANHGAATLALMRDLDAIVLAAGGRLYPAKDGRMSAHAFQESYPDWRKVEALRDPLISSAFWRRVTQHDG
ncbi:MAG: FAD-binding protein [Oceanicaulis sp.]